MKSKKIVNIILFLSFVSMTVVEVQSSYKSDRSNITLNSAKSYLLPGIERVFSRKRRFLLMPKGGHLKATIQLSKRLLAVVPRGMNMVFEAALYYPGPTSRIDLIPKRLRDPTTTTPKPPPQPPQYVYIPGTEIRYKAKHVGKPASKLKPLKVQRIDEEVGGVKWMNNKQTKWQQYEDPQRWSHWNNANYNNYNKYAWTAAKQDAVNKKWTKWTTEAPSWRDWALKEATHSRWMRSPEADYDDRKSERILDESHNIENLFYEDFETAAYKPMIFPDLEEFDESQHYHGHRDRRQLLHQFGALSKIFGIDMHSCVLRAICETKRLLMPPGYSMLHDILRIVLTFPTINGLDDGYSRLMHMDYEVCHKRLRKKCSVNLLEWLLQPPQKRNPTVKQ